MAVGSSGLGNDVMVEAEGENLTSVRRLSMADLLHATHAEALVCPPERRPGDIT